MVLMDTHALVWLMEGLPSLGAGTRALVAEARASNEAIVSTISFWEVAMLASKGRVNLTHPANAWRRRVLEWGIIEVPVSCPLGLMAGSLPDIHGDPSDRTILATSIEEGATLVTADRLLLDWPGTLARHDARI